MKTKMTRTNTYPLFFPYETTYKVGIDHTPFHLVYGLHPLLPTKYLLPFKPKGNTNPTPI
jgi:hypothetical protein